MNHEATDHMLKMYVPTGGTGQAETQALRPDVIAAAQKYFESDDRLHGDRVPEVTILNEQPIHRLMIYLHAQGKTRSEIAKQVGYTPQMVGTILRQPWARERLIQILKECGEDEVKHFLKTEVSPSLMVLREVRDHPAAKPTDRIAASREILDRALGKATIHVESNNTNVNIPTDMARLDAELEALRKQTAGRGNS